MSSTIQIQPHGTDAFRSHGIGVKGRNKQVVDAVIVDVGEKRHRHGKQADGIRCRKVGSLARHDGIVRVPSILQESQTGIIHIGQQKIYQAIARQVCQAQGRLFLHPDLATQLYRIIERRRCRHG